MTPGTTQSARWPAISKDVQAFPVSPNLPDYETACSRFSWADARAALSGLPDGGLNMAYEAVDRHATGPRANHPALRFIRADGSAHDVSYAELSEQTNRFAAVLTQLGIGRGDRVFSLTGRGPQLYVAVLGTSRTPVFLPAVFGVRAGTCAAASSARERRSGHRQE